MSKFLRGRTKLSSNLFNLPKWKSSKHARREDTSTSHLFEYFQTLRNGHVDDFDIYIYLNLLSANPLVFYIIHALHIKNIIFRLNSFIILPYKHTIK
jgi:hypothetical protein